MISIGSEYFNIKLILLKMKDWGIWQQSIPINTEVHLVDSAWMTIEHCPAEVRLNNFADLIDFVKVVISQKSIKRIINLCISVQVFAATRAFFSDREDLFQLVFCFALFCFVLFCFFFFFYRRNSNCDTDLKFWKAWETVSRVSPRVSPLNLAQRVYFARFVILRQN